MKIKPIINAHTHIFSAGDVPPFIARCFVPFPLYILTYFPLVFGIFRASRRFYKPKKKLIALHKRLIGGLKSNTISYFLFLLFLFWVAFNAVYFIADYAKAIPNHKDARGIIRSLSEYYVIYPDIPAIVKWSFIIVGLISTKWLRQLIVKLSKAVIKPLSYLPNSKSLEFGKRYMKIAKIANYQKQATAYNKLYKMYPPGSKFVVLTMDMTYMNLTPPRDFYEQLDEISGMMDTDNDNYKNIIPFLFVDPRRIEDDADFFKWHLEDGDVLLDECKLKRYLEDGHFRGIKIYPALGYHAFDELLLPLWKYCVQQEIPITSHCTVGTVFYRRRMKSKWFTHPVFKMDSGQHLQIPARKNIELQKNFTNPLNYLVLLEPEFLKVHLANCRPETQAIFGYSSSQPEADLTADLSKLKINIAHYGGIEQWRKHQDSDRHEYAQELLEMPDVGVRLFAQQSNGKVKKPGKPGELWHKLDWYTTISSLMLQYENVYADISYILHTPDIQALLNLSLENAQLRQKILFGTDYYVVRNHKSEKELYADMLANFSEEQMDQIAIVNPNRFLKIKSDSSPILQ